jgi:hypothetical protein
MAIGILRGSEQQIQWAEGLRSAELPCLERFMERLRGVMAAGGTEAHQQELDRAERAYCEILAETDARYWIDRRGRDSRELIRERILGIW